VEIVRYSWLPGAVTTGRPSSIYRRPSSPRPKGLATTYAALHELHWLNSNPETNPTQAMSTSSQRPDWTRAGASIHVKAPHGHSRRSLHARPLSARHTAEILSSRKLGLDSGNALFPSPPLVLGMFCLQN